MARQVRRISDLPEATELTGDELLEIVQGGGNKRVSVSMLGGGVEWGEIGGLLAEQTDLVAALGEKVNDDDDRLTDAREWTAPTVTQAEAEDGTDTERRAWTVQRVWQAIYAQWLSVTSAFGRGLVASADAAAGRSALGLGNLAVRSGVACQLHGADNISLPSGTIVQMTFTQTRFDSGGMSGLPAQTSNITVPETGLYLVTVAADISSTTTASGTANLRVRVGGGAPQIIISAPFADGNANQLSGAGFLFLNAGNAVNAQITQNSGVTRTSRGSAWSNVLTVARIA